MKMAGLSCNRNIVPTANNDESEDSESHDEEEEDDLEAMETNQTTNTNIVATTDVTTYSAPEF